MSNHENNGNLATKCLETHYRVIQSRLEDLQKIELSLLVERNSLCHLWHSHQERLKEVSAAIRVTRDTLRECCSLVDPCYWEADNDDCMSEFKESSSFDTDALKLIGELHSLKVFLQAML